MTLYLGVDPGASGALACLDADGILLWAEDMPTPLHGATIAGLLDDAVYKAAVEDVHSMPRQGVASTFKFGMAHGIVLGALGALNIPYRLVPPGTWKRTMGLIGRDKTASRRKAIELWPDHADLFRRKRDDGRAEAALIALWLQEQEQRGRRVA